MVRTSIFLAAVATASTTLAQSTGATKCSLNKLCPESAPCCSQYGECGVGAYCLGGCDPRMSFSLESCAPEPVCKDTSSTFTNMDRIMSKTEYLGDSSKTDWVMDGDAVIYNDNVLLTMAEGTVGTLLASSTYMWYGNVKAKLKTSRGAGVVTAFILLSDVKDEIDYEFVGTELSTAQTNFYFQGIPNYENSANISLSDTFNNYHTYEIDWTPDEITWSVDGQVGRTKKRSETWNATSNRWDFPQTPARVQLSLWPGGLATNGQGTIDWAGGEISWDSPDVTNNGYYYASFESVDISCYNGKSAPGTNSGTSYTYTDRSGLNTTVDDGSDQTVLSSFLATGTNMTLGETTNSGSKPSATVQSVPGLSGAGPGTNEHGGSSDSSGSSAVTSITSSPSDAPSGDSGSGTSGSGGFNQGAGSGSTGGAGRLAGEEKVLKGSLFAGIIAVVAMMAL